MAAYLPVFRKPFVNVGDEVGQQRQYLYFCTRNASKLSPKAPVVNVGEVEQQRQYLYFCTRKASSKLSPQAPVVNVGDEVDHGYLAFLSCVLLDLLAQKYKC